MRGYARTSPPMGLLAIGAGFLVLATVLVLFSRELFLRFTLSAPSGIVAILAILVLPGILVGLLIYQTVRLVRDRARRRPGALLKTRFILFILTLVLAATVPLELVSFNFIDLGTSFWLSAGIDSSIEGATRLALDYSATTLSNLRVFSTSRLLTQYLAAASRGSASEWRDITEASPFVSFIQVFDASGRELVFHSVTQELAGEVRARSLDELMRFPEAPNQVRRANVSFLRSRLTRVVGGTTYHVALGSILSPDFFDTARGLEDARDLLETLQLVPQRISLVILGIYFLFTLPLLLLCLLVSFYLAHELVLPIMSLEDAIRRVAQGDFSFRVLVRSRDELSILVNSFNRMVTELSDSRQKLLRAEKIAAWKEIARRLAHELRNPLTPIKLSAQRILRRLQAPHTAEEMDGVVESSVQAIVREVDLLDGLLREFSEFARLPEPTRASVRIAEVARQAMSVYAPGSPAVRFDTSGLREELVVFADAEQLRRVFSNLLANAIHAMPGGGTLTIQADVVRKGESSYCRVVVRDTGVGMDEETRRQAFSPYFTTRKDGTGLGLAIVERIIFDHNGQIWIESHAGSGTTVYLDLPLP